MAQPIHDGAAVNSFISLNSNLSLIPHYGIQ